MDNFNESYHVNTVHRPKGAAVEKLRIHSGIDTSYKNTRFDMTEEGHNRMIMLGGYGGPAIDKEGIVGEPLAGVLRDWELDPDAVEAFGLTADGIAQALRGAGLQVVSVATAFDVAIEGERMRPLMGIGRRARW